MKNCRTIDIFTRAPPLIDQSCELACVVKTLVTICAPRTKDSFQRGVLDVPLLTKGRKPIIVHTAIKIQN